VTRYRFASGHFNTKAGGDAALSGILRGGDVLKIYLKQWILICQPEVSITPWLNKQFWFA